MARKSNFDQAGPAAQEQARVEAEHPKPVAERTRKPQKVFVVTPEQDHQIRMYCASSKTTVQDLVMQGINLVLKSKGLPEI